MALKSCNVGKDCNQKVQFYFIINSFRLGLSAERMPASHFFNISGHLVIYFIH